VLAFDWYQQRLVTGGGVVGARRKGREAVQWQQRRPWHDTSTRRWRGRSTLAVECPTRRLFLPGN